MRLSNILFGALPLLPSAFAAVSTIYSDVATYCSPPSSIFINDFSVTYHRPNNSLVFYVSLDSRQAGVNVDANIIVNAYGMDLINRTLDICSLIGGVLCPLPQLNISGTSVRQAWLTISVWHCSITG
jgi:hypothetical protein